MGYHALMSVADGSNPETAMRSACEAGDYATAATRAIELYGGEILAFLGARLRSSSDGEEVFASFTEKLWVGLAGFEWRTSLRGWAYGIARNAANDFAATPRNRGRNHVALSDNPVVLELMTRLRTTTQLYRKTAVKDRMRELRETLPDDDQMLLVLRVDRDMSWRDLAAAISDGRNPDAPELEREAARLRKRFERVKEQLRELARAEGLLK